MAAYDWRGAERSWRAAWRRAEHRARALPRREHDSFVQDAAPFTNAGLHMGHVRTYVLGDVTARYRRAQGERVLYVTAFDAFGLPIELQAIAEGVAPRELVARSIRTMTRQLRALGVSYDYARVPSTCEPEYYRWTQWLFLELLAAGLVERRRAPQPWCPSCETTLAELQLEGGCCWRCEAPVELRESPQWFVCLSRYVEELRDTLDSLEGWSPRARASMRSLLGGSAERRGGRGAADWLVSRPRSWGTPIPLVECERCGFVPVPRDELPVRLPDDLDWSSGAGALARAQDFVRTSCPECGRAARRATDTLDCFFDDIWCFLSPFVLGGEPPGFSRESLAAWRPVDRAQSGLDTFYSFHLYRFLARFLVERGLLSEREPVRGFFGNDLVLAGGRKMSKHLGNALSPDDVLEEFGADALRLAVLRAAGPQRPIEWRREHLLEARGLLEALHQLVTGFVAHERDAPARAPSGTASRAASALRRAAERATSDVARFIEEHRPHAALTELARLLRRSERFASARVPTGRLGSADSVVLRGVVETIVMLSAPFAPHLAEECWGMLGHGELLAAGRWPRREERDVDRVSAG